MSTKKILIVEDSKPQVRFLTKWLEYNNFEVIYCYSLKEVEPTIEEHKFKIDIVLMDVIFKDDKHNGIKEISNVRKKLDCYGIKVAFMTRGCTKDTVKKMLKVKSDDIITKPFRLNILIKRINNMIEKRAKHVYFLNDTLLGQPVFLKKIGKKVKLVTSLNLPANSRVQLYSIHKDLAIPLEIIIEPTYIDINNKTLKIYDIVSRIK